MHLPALASLVGATSLLLVAAACGEASTPVPTATPTPESQTAASPTPSPEAEVTPTTQPEAEVTPTAQPEAASRRIEIDATSDIVFDPGQLSVKPGETVEFVVTNTSNLFHTFTLATSADKESILTDLELSGGQQKTAIVTFSEEPTTLYLFCRPHESFGMTGAIAVGTSGKEDPDTETSGTTSDSGDYDSPY